MRFRPFLNSDSSGIAAVWNRQPQLRGRLAELSPNLLEQHVLAKPHFDPAGLILALDQDRVAGFVHAGFVPGEHQGALTWEQGVICLLMIDPDVADPSIPRELVRLAEEYLMGRGAKELVAGATGWRAPFYLGFYGGSSLPGVLAGDEPFLTASRTAGYDEHLRIVILHRTLADFRPPMDRQFVQFRRQYRLVEVPEAATPKRWDETCAAAWIDRTQLDVQPTSRGESAVRFTFWDMEPMSSSWRRRAVGLLEVPDSSPHPSELMVCFLGESLRHFQSHGIDMVEIQVEESRVAMLDGCRKLGFQEVDRGIQLRKAVAS